jgi:hypothetical protein
LKQDLRLAQAERLLTGGAVTAGDDWADAWTGRPFANGIAAWLDLIVYINQRVAMFPGWHAEDDFDVQRCFGSVRAEPVKA